MPGESATVHESGNRTTVTDLPASCGMPELGSDILGHDAQAPGVGYAAPLAEPRRIRACRDAEAREGMGAAIFVEDATGRRGRGERT